MHETTYNYTFVPERPCDCDERCSRCGRRKVVNPLGPTWICKTEPTLAFRIL